MRFDDLGLLLGVIEIQIVPHMLDHDVQFDILWHLHFYVSCLIHSLRMLTLNVKSLLCSLDLVACMIIALSCILLLMRLDLFAACGVHQSHYSCLLCGLICSSLCVTLLWLRYMLFHHGIHLQYRCDLQLARFYTLLRWVALVIHIFLVVDGEWVFRVIIDDYYRSCGFCA
jgi:hypothetical protein